MGVILNGISTALRLLMLLAIGFVIWAGVTSGNWAGGLIVLFPTLVVLGILSLIFRHA